MTIQDDETLQMYLEESLEHLADIENDFLAIEADGANINEDLVNKVYRAAHSIKGGAGFMGLTNIKDLTHEMENILGKIRSREMIPSPAIVNVLLKAADKLNDLMEDILNSNDVDIRQHITALQDVLAGKINEETELEDEPASEQEADAEQDQTVSETDEPSEVEEPPAPADAPTNPISLSFPGEAPALTLQHADLSPLFEQGKCVYFVKTIVQEDILDRQKTCQSVLEEMEQTGTIVGANIDLPESGTIDADWVAEEPVLYFVFGSILKPGDINILFEIADENILELRSDLSLYQLDGGPAVKSPKAPKPTAKPAASPKPSKTAPKPEAEKKTVKKAKNKKQPVAKEPVEQPMAAQQAPSPFDLSGDSSAGKKTSKFEHETSLRVHVSLLDQLMTLAGELVLSRNQLLQSMTSNDQRGSEIAGQRIDLITSELQEAIMLTRMQSIGNVFNKFPRVVRDLAQALGKQVELTLEGKEVELDKTIIEAIGDPLTHLVRNAVDHGIEMPSTRHQTGKNEVGQIYLKAYHEAGQVNIEITDDGAGLDGGKLAAKAIEKGLISEEQAKVMSAREKTNLIFLPGFSTAEKITDVSGRGVGMDVVKTNLDKLGGIIDIDSKLGKGTTIRIKLPLTLAIIPCQIVLTGGERYAIPR